MGWAKYNEDNREIIEDRMRMRSDYLYASIDFNSYLNTNRKIESYGTYRKETKIVKRPC